MKPYYLLSLILLLLTIGSKTFSQEEQNGKGQQLKLTADLVSSFVWRGSLSTKNPIPSFQPTMSWTHKAIEIGVWGSTGLIDDYKEIDPYLSFSINNIKLTVTDYNWDFEKANYFNFKNSETRHRIEGSITYSGSEKFPISLSLSTFFYGCDKKAEVSTRQAFSTYVELGYSYGITNFFFGFTPWKSLYNNYGTTTFDASASQKNFSIVNIGSTVTKEFKINDKLVLPIKGSLIVNPSASYSRKDFVHLVVSVTF